MNWNKFNQQLRNVVDTGKLVTGVKQSTKECLIGEPKLIILSKTVEKTDRDIFKYYSKLLKIKLIEYPESGLELASVCGKPFSISTIVIKDFGESSILDVIDEKIVEVKDKVKAKKEKKQNKREIKERAKKLKALKKKEKEEKPIEEDEMYKAIVKIRKK